MPINKKVRDLMDSAGCRYEVHAHPEAFTAQGLAAVEHTPGHEIVKVVILKGNENYYMAALPAPCKVDLARFAALVGVPSVRLATEEEFKDLFPGCETGAMPPFGNVFGLRYKSKAEFAGGVILILLGTKILLEHLGVL